MSKTLPNNRKKANRPGKYHPWRADVALSKKGQQRLAERRLRAMLEKLEEKEK